MKIISHRGNLTGPNPLRENSVDYIEEAISYGFDVEIDLWVEDGEIYLGHDDPQYFVTMGWLRKYKDILWIHCKNREALEKMSSSMVQFNYFWHQSDKYTITSKAVGLSLVGQIPYSNSVVVMPEMAKLDDEYIKNSFGICTDLPIFYRDNFGVNNEMGN